MTITPAQQTRLQTICSQMAKHVIGFENTREARLAWASSQLNRAVDSFSTLTTFEARKLIDLGQGVIGHRAPLKSNGVRQRRSSEAARRAGLDGRKSDTEFADRPELVSAELLTEIADRYHRLGWGAAQFESFLAGRSSPTRGRKLIRTTAEAHQVLWALKSMLQDRGLWIDFTEKVA